MIENEFLDLSPKDAANRAIQAFFGLGLFVLSSGASDKMINDLTKDTLSTLEIVAASSDAKNIQIYRDTREMFYKILDNQPFSILEGPYASSGKPRP